MNDDNIKWAQEAIEAKKLKIQQNRAENARLEAEIPDLEAYIRVEKAKPQGSERPQSAPAVSPTGPSSDVIYKANWLEMLDPNKRGAKKRAILATLTTVEAAETGWIISAIKHLKIEGATIDNTSPQLSAYKADGLVDLTPSGWKITQKGRDYLAKTN